MAGAGYTDLLNDSVAVLPVLLLTKVVSHRRPESGARGLAAGPEWAKVAHITHIAAVCIGLLFAFLGVTIGDWQANVALVVLVGAALVVASALLVVELVHDA
jgi:hypothetical protein